MCRPIRKPGAGDPRPIPARAQALEPLDRCQRGAARAHGVVGLRDRRAPEGDHAVALEVLHGAVLVEHRPADRLEVLVELGDHRLGRELLGQGREAAEVDEEHRELAAGARQRDPAGLAQELGGHVLAHVALERALDQLALAQARRHVVERVAERLELVARRDRDARAELAPPDLPRRAAQREQRPRDPARQDETHGERRGQHHQPDTEQRRAQIAIGGHLGFERGEQQEPRVGHRRARVELGAQREEALAAAPPRGPRPESVGRDRTPARDQRQIDPGDRAQRLEQLAVERLAQQHDAVHLVAEDDRLSAHQVQRR